MISIIYEPNQSYDNVLMKCEIYEMNQKSKTNFIIVGFPSRRIDSFPTDAAGGPNPGSTSMGEIFTITSYDTIHHSYDVRNTWIVDMICLLLRVTLLQIYS